MIVHLMRRVENVEGFRVVTWWYRRHHLSRGVEGLGIECDFHHVVRGSFVTYVVTGLTSDGYFDWYDARTVATRHYSEVLTSDE